MTAIEYVTQALTWIVVGSLAGVPLGQLVRPMVLRQRRREREQ